MGFTLAAHRCGEVVYAVISDVYDGGPEAKAGLRPGMRVYCVNSKVIPQEVRTPAMWIKQQLQHTPVVRLGVCPKSHAAAHTQSGHSHVGAVGLGPYQL